MGDFVMNKSYLGDFVMNKSYLEKYKDIIKEMTFEEKTKLLTGSDNINTYEIERLSIPSIKMSDGPNGLRTSFKQRYDIDGGNLCAPTESALAATWNRDMVYKVGEQLGLNCRKQEVDVLLAPGVNMMRLPNCGRNYEYFSEDPVLAGELAAEYINGVQSKGVGTSLKHYAVNNQELFRRVVNAEVDERTLREYYLRVFEIALSKSNPTSVMCAYNKINGIFCSENHKLLTKILRDEWNYDGMLISDWGAVHNIAKAINAGTHLQMPRNLNITEQLKAAVENNVITEEAIDEAVAYVLKFIDDIKNLPNDEVEFDRNKGHEIMQEAAEESITLLRNEDNTLPIVPNKYAKIGVLGYFADHPEMGGSTYVEVDEKSIDSPVEYIKKYAGDKTEIIYEPIYDKMDGKIDFDDMLKIQAIAKEVDMLIMFVGNPRYWEAEGEDRKTISLPEYMVRIAEECIRFCDNTVVVAQTGAAYQPFSVFVKPPKALVQMWFNGEGGGKAIAEVLFGLVNPSGKLPMTFMKSQPDIEFPGDGRKLDYTDRMFVGYRHYDNHTDDIWYPFGYGLSYTDFEYSDISVTPNNSNDPDTDVEVTFSVKNVGKMAGKEVVQVYVSPRDISVVRPVKELCGFDKIFLEAGEKKTVTIKLDSRAFSYYNTNLEEWHVESGIYDILVGASSQDIRLAASYDVEWDGDYTIRREKWDYLRDVVIAATAD